MSRADRPVERILLAQSGFLGDVVLTTPLVAALRRRFPAARLAMLVTPVAAPLVAAHPALDLVLVDDKRGRDAGPRGLARLVRRLRAERFDVAVTPHKSLRTALALRAAGIPRRIGFATAPGARLYSARVARPLALHDRDRMLELLRPLDAYPAPGEDRHPWIAVDAGTRTRAAALLAPERGGGRRLAGISPGSAWRTKRWPTHAWADLVRGLEAAGWRCLLLGAPDERGLTAEVCALAGCGRDLGGTTDLALLAGVLALMDVVVTNDSAPMHLASAAGVPQVAVFCATTPAQGYGPLGLRAVIVEKDLACRPCGRHGGRHCPRGTDDCMELLEVGEVREAIERAHALAA